MENNLSKTHKAVEKLSFRKYNLQRSVRFHQEPQNFFLKVVNTWL